MKARQMKFLCYSFFLFFVLGCKKVVTDPTVQSPTSNSPGIQNNTGSGKYNQTVNYSYRRDINVPITVNPPKGKIGGINLTCGDVANDLVLTYVGFTDEGNCSGGRTITVKWNLFYPVAEVNCTTESINPVLGLNSFATITTGISGSMTSPLYAQGVYYDDDYPLPQIPCGQARVELSASFNLTEAEYNFIGGFDFTMQCATDCPYAPSIQPVSTMTETLDPAVYKVHPVIAINSSAGGVHKMTVFPAVTLCMPAHGPTLGTTPQHIFKYRFASGNEDWDYNHYVYFTNLNSVDVVVNSAGTYEYKSKGIILPGPIYSRYSVVQQVVVQ